MILSGGFHACQTCSGFAHANFTIKLGRKHDVPVPNGAFLLNSAQAQNSYKDPSYSDYGIETPSALDNFTQAIQSQILGGLLTNINTGKPGRMVTNDFIIDIANRDGQLQLNVTDRKSGKTSTIEVSGLQTQSTDF